ncbi:ATP-binding cassette domain-containing protein [Mollicutes bacterium LVI A0078]|nr:ATP-binding cassette domain-containing protein [Mollicutes bacterium LVI A0075]WOO91125.1 ATP-binding cassette domain-containing protein [Mollicutes bacterium LVI A0078]
MLKITYDDIIFDNQIILNKAEIEFDKGITTLVGENGSGKTTILNLLYLEQLDFNPQITLDDTLISEMNISEYRNTYIVYITQSNILFSNQSISQAIELIVGEYDRDLYEELCDVLMFREVIKRNPKVAKLSGGEKQKLKILCGLLKNVKVVLFDEPFNNLDKQTIGNLNNYLKTDDKYFIITSHIDLLEDYTQYKIENKKITYTKVENYHETINTNPPKQLSGDALKGLRNANKKIRIPLYIVNVVVVIILMLAIANTLHVYRIATIDRSNFIFGDTATLIKAPIENDSFLTFGTEKWLEKIPTYFSDDDIARLESLSYVESVIPVKSDGYGMNGVDYKNKYILDIPATEEVEYNFSSALYPKQVAENLPSQSYITGSGFIESFVTGTFPKDNSNEVIVDTYAADYIIENVEYDNYNQLVGQTVTVPVFERDNPNKKFTIDFVISGVFKPIESIDNSIVNSTIVPGFDIENRFVQSTYTQYQTVDEIYGRIHEK